MEIVFNDKKEPFVIYKFILPPDIKVVTNIDMQAIHESFHYKDADLLLFLTEFSCDNFDIRLGRYVKVAKQGRALCFDQEFLGRKVSIYIEDLEEKQTKLYISNYDNVVKIPLPMRDLVRAGDLVTSVLLIKAIQRGWLLAHAATLVTEQYGGILITSYPDTGKTTTTYLLSQMKGFIPLSDDLAWISREGEFIGEGVGPLSIYSLAEREAFRKYCKILTIRSSLASLLRYIYYLPYAPQFLLKFSDKLTTLTQQPQLNHKRIGTIEKYRCNYMFILESGKEEIIKLEHDVGAKKFLEICRREHYYLNHNFILLTYSYISNGFDLEKVYHERERIIRDFTHKVQPYIIRAPHPRDFAKLIIRILERS
jgi:hypothetical protein